MSVTELDAAIAAARAYDELFVPAMFRQFAPLILDAVDLEAGDSLLDVACGTGVVAIAGAEHGASRVCGLDLSPGMVAVARDKAPALEWQQGDAAALPYDDATFDVVVCQFGLMFFPDRAGAIGEMLRVLKPGGRIGIAVWAGLEHNPAFAAEVEVLERIAGATAADALRAPFALGDRGDFEALLDRSELAGCNVDTRAVRADFPSLRSLVEADLRGWLPVMGVNLPEDTIGAVLVEALEVMAGFVDHDGHARFPVAAHLATATR
ncbi:MAG: class I SAM-dependent methyltransferase [Gammaproteobacteria bacterium]